MYKLHYIGFFLSQFLEYKGLNMTDKLLGENTVYFFSPSYVCKTTMRFREVFAWTMLLVKKSIDIP